MSSLPIKPLDGESGYLRWKDSLLLRLRTLGLAAHVLLSYEEGSIPGGGENEWAHDDALCRGHILTTLSDRLVPVYAHHATAGELWRAVARTYDEPDMTSASLEKALREQLALLQAFATAGNLSDCDVVDIVKKAGFPEWMSAKVARDRATLCMDDIRDIARKQVMMDSDKQTSRACDDFRPRKRGRPHGRS